MKIAILSDIHGNVEALRSITDSYDEMWVLGDLVNYGPDPGDVVDFVRKNAAVVVRGNHDHAVGHSVDPRCSPPFREMAHAMQTYSESVLSNEQKAYLRQLPLTARREAGGHRFFLCHAAPSDPLYQYAPPEAALWSADVQAIDADVLLVGHTHLPFVLEFGEKRVINPGSVGQPKQGVPETCYAIWENGAVTFKSHRYPVEETVRKLLALPVESSVRQQLAAVVATGTQPGSMPLR